MLSIAYRRCNLSAGGRVGNEAGRTRESITAEDLSTTELISEYQVDILSTPTKSTVGQQQSTEQPFLTSWLVASH